MMQSMTGYANAIIDIPIKDDQKLLLSLQIKSLNSRYFDITYKIPSCLIDLDISIQKLIKNKLQRGHIYITIKIQQNHLKHDVIPSLSTIKGYIEAINIVKKECNIKDEISLNTILQLPDIFQTEDEVISKTTETIVLEELDKLIDQIVIMRLEEGSVIEKDINNQIKIIEKNLALIKTVSDKMAKEKKEEFNVVIEKLQTFSQEDICANKCFLESQKSTLLSELEKIDIHEEVIRANSHLVSIEKWIEIKELSKGKKLDFILQELNREVNTIASKCSNFSISSLAIDIKSELEKCREQTQNVV